MPQPRTARVLIPIVEGRRGRRRAGAEKRHPCCSGRSTCRLTTTVRRHSIPIILVARRARVGVQPAEWGVDSGGGGARGWGSAGRVRIGGWLFVTRYRNVRPRVPADRER